MNNNSPKIIEYKLLPSEHRDKYECFLCKSQNSVKYFARIEYRPDFHMHVPVCNKCVLIYK